MTYFAYNDELKRLKGGIFVKKAIADWDKKISGEIRHKILLFSAHDLTSKNYLNRGFVNDCLILSFECSWRFQHLGAALNRLWNHGDVGIVAA